MIEAFLALAGTEAGARAAAGLALVSALAHAAFGALQKGRHDPWLTRGAIDGAGLVLWLPVALFLVPWPEPPVWGALLGAFLIHLAYKGALGMAYARAPFTVVYPVVRGTGPVATVLLAGLAFGERLLPLQWLGLLLLSGAILGLAAVSLSGVRVGRAALGSALGLAVLTGVIVALYTVWDAWGIRLAANPFSFLAWWFVFEGLVFPLLALRRWRRMAAPPAPGPLLLRGLAGAGLAVLSFGGVMLAARIGSVGEAAVLRETSTVFAALIGRFLLGERILPAAWALILLVAAGAVVVKLGGA